MLGGLAQRNGGPVGLLALVAILLLGLGLRFDYAWEGREPVFDATAYAKIARNLDEGRGFTLGPSATQPASNYSPGLPLLAAGIYKATGGVHERLARLALALIGALSILFTYLIARRLSGPAAGLIGAAAIAIYPALLEYQGMLMGEPLATTLLPGAVLAILWAAEPRPGDLARGSCRGGGGPAGEVYVLDPPPPRHPRVRWLLPGALLGALTLVRPEYLSVVVLLALAVLAKEFRVDWRTSMTRAVVLLAGAAIVVVPWTVRNAVVLDRFVPVSTGGGQVFFAGTYLPSDGDPEKVGREVLKRHPELVRKLASKHLGPPDSAPSAPLQRQREAVLERVQLEQILAALAAQRYPGVDSDRALARMGREQLWDDVTEQPLEYTGFVATKVGRIWSHGPRDVMRRPVWEALHWVLVGFGLLGLVVLAWRRRWEALVLATIFLSITAISALLVASPRRVLVMMPLVAALAGVGAISTYAWLQRRRASDFDPPPVG